MMNGFSRREGICPISHNDLESLAESYMRTFNGSPWFDKWDIKTAYDRLHDLYRSSGSYGLAVWQEGEPLGAVMGVMEKYFDGDVFRIIELWTDPDHRGEGLGRRLLEEMKSWVFGNGGVRLYLITLKTTETVGFYEHCGFAVDKGMCVMSLADDNAVGSI